MNDNIQYINPASAYQRMHVTVIPRNRLYWTESIVEGGGEAWK